MKIIYFIIIVSLMTTISCSDEIELVPPSTVIVDDLYKTETDFAQAMVGIYTAVRGQYNGFWEIGDLRADDVWQEATNQTGRVLTDNFQGHTAAEDVWSDGYAAITRANVLLEKIEDVDLENKEQYIGEAKFLRALTYFNLVRIFGDVPLLTSPISPEEAFTAGRDDVNRIYDELIIPDLVQAGNALPLQYSGADLGRATKGAAKALLGKVWNGWYFT